MLKAYKTKRDFSKTKEPAGEKKKSGSGDLVFMIHKHHASHLHYDLRLELDGVLKSWAVPKWPSMDPEVKRLAMMVEDHPYEYKDYEGVIPEGEYGAGPSMIWDMGTYEPKDDQGNKETNEELLRKKLEKWHLSFVLHGKKLHGEFSLVHIPGRDKKDNTWLLVKSPDEYANTEIPDKDYSVVSGRTIEELRNGGSPKISVNSGKKGKIPKNVKPMLATLVDKPFDRKDWIFEIKWDGYRTIAEIENGKVHLYSRNRLSFDEHFPKVAEELKHYPDVVFDGEIVAFDEDGNSDFELLQNYLKSREGTLGYYVFDLLYYDGRILTDLELRERKATLRQILTDSQHIKYTDHIEGRGKDFFEVVKTQNLEGIIGKNTKSTYRFGERWPNWVKIKNILTEEAIICGYTEPRGSRKGFGALILGTYENGKLVYVGHTGGGFNDKSLTETKKLLDTYRTDICPFETVPKTNERPTWIEPRLVAEIKFREWTKDGIMRQPIYLGLREDKDPKEVRREKKEHTKTLIPEEEPTRKAKKSIKNRSIHFTNLDKIYFPEDGLTKGNIIEYYERIAPYILPYLRDRPETLVRYPDGIYGEEFYQKNLNKAEAPEWICTEEVASESENRSINYAVVCKDIESLLYLANLGCIDLHPWGSRVGSLDYPDYIVFDFDPEDIDFKEVVKAARTTYELLEEIKIPAYCKTSGATGIHILVPTGAQYAYEQATAFAKLINTIVHSRLPETTSLERSPKKRQKKVYLDYLQNRRGQTIASIYSIRPRVWAPVSTPIEPDELTEDLDPLDFNIHTIFDRLENNKWDLWKGMLKKKFDMEKAIERLGKILDN